MWLECITTQCGRLWGQCFSCVTLRHPEQEIMLKNSSRWDHQNSYASPCQKTTRNSWPIRHMNNTAEKSVFDSSKHKKVRIWEKKEYVHYSHLGSRGKTLMSECGQRCTPCLFRAHATERTLPRSWCPLQLKGVWRFSHILLLMHVKFTIKGLFLP